MRIKIIRMRKLPLLAVGLLSAAAIISAALIAPYLYSSASTKEVIAPALFGKSIVIDAGHGGWDPGVVGNNVEEKTVNLAIAQILAEIMRSGGASVIMTREADTALGESKSDDIKQRVQLTEEAEADLFISIHANSFPQAPSTHGAQVFYGTDNQQGELLAKAIQTSLNEAISGVRQSLVHREAYLLKHISQPAVIVETGFLSNSAEAQYLTDNEYCWQLAWAIYEGAVSFLSDNQSNTQQD